MHSHACWGSSRQPRLQSQLRHGLCLRHLHAVYGGRQPSILPPLASAPNLSLQGDDPLSTAAVDISVLRSFLDMLSSGGITPLPSGQAGAAPAAGEAEAAPAVHDPAHVPPLSVAATGMGGSGSGSGGSGHMGGAFSAFKPTGSGSGGNGAAAADGGLGSGGAKPDS